VLPDRSLEDVFVTIRQIGSLLDNEIQAQSLLTRTQTSLEEVRTRTRLLSRPRVLCVVDRVPGTLRDLYVATKGSFLEELIKIAGGQSIAPANSAGYGKMSKEAVLALNPAILVDMVQGAKGKLAEDPLTVWRQLSEIDAVRDGRIYPMKETSVLHLSQFVADTCRTFARVIHPEAF